MANPTPAREWKRDKGEEVELPSGNIALIKRPGMERLFAAGVLPDELTKLALAAVDEAESGGRPQDHKKKASENLDPELMKTFMSKEGALQDIFASFDKITEMCVLSPPVKYHRRIARTAAGEIINDPSGAVTWEDVPPNERDEEFVYTDDVDMDDKTFIFNFVVGGSRDLETFREEYGDALATVQPREDVELPPVPTSEPPV